MLHGTFVGEKQKSLMGEYAALLGGALLRHRAQIAEKSARVEAELASRIKSEFIANMSHELRTPLNTVLGFSKLLSEQETKPLSTGEIVQYSGMIHDAAEHLLAIINNILDISKIQSGRYALDIVDFDLNELLTACASSLRLEAAEADIAMTVEGADQAFVMHGDAVKVRQIMTNLLTNAIKFTQRGGRVSVSSRMLPGRKVELLVQDTGVGMTTDEIRVALMPFGQVDGGRSRWREGTGLGLPIAKSLAELHGGSLKVASEKSKGTTVSVILPVDPPSHLEDTSDRA